MRLQPQITGTRERIDSGFAPPSRFITMAMQLTMMATAQGDSELIADLAAERPALGETHVVGVAGLAATEETRLLRHKAHMLPIADAPRLWMSQCGIIDDLCPRHFRFRFRLIRLDRLWSICCSLLRRRYFLCYLSCLLGFSPSSRWAAIGMVSRKTQQLGAEHRLDVLGVGGIELVLVGEAPFGP